MQYMGGKERIQKHIIQLISDYQMATGATKYLEPFVGGASIASRACALFDEVVLADAEPLVVDLWNAARSGWVPPVLTSEVYRDLRKLVNAGLTCGYAAFGVSFGGKRWGGFAKNSPGFPDRQGTQIRGIAHKAAGLTSDLKRASFIEHTPGEGWLVYCDPPYAGTTGYGNQEWDADLFWQTVSEWHDAGATVLVSEYAAPKPWVCVCGSARNMSRYLSTLSLLLRGYSRDEH